MSERQTALVMVISPSGAEIPGTAEVEIIAPQQAFWKGARRSGKLIALGALIVLPFGFLEPFLFMLWGSGVFLILLLIIGPYLHLRFASETASFAFVKAACPHCQSLEPLKPYLSTRFVSSFTVICSSCGQTSPVKSTGTNT